MQQETSASRLKRVALAHFARHGLMGARTKAIAEGAGVDETTLFRLFGTKRNLFRAAMRSALDEHFGDTVNVSFQKFDGSFSEGIRAFARDFSTSLRSEEGDAFERALQFAALEDPELLSDWIEGQVLPLVLRLGEIIQHAIDRGEAVHPRPYIAARILIDALVGSHQFLWWMGANRLREFSYENPEDHVTDIWLGGILVAPEPKRMPKFKQPTNPIQNQTEDPK